MIEPVDNGIDFVAVVGERTPHFNPKLRLDELIGRPAQMYLGLSGNALTARIRSPVITRATGCRVSSILAYMFITHDLLTCAQ